MASVTRKESLEIDGRPLATVDLAHIRELDGVRGVAVLSVFLHHICHLDAPGDWSPIVRGIFRVSVHGSAGVDLFFVLSGFLITSILMRAQNRPRYYQDFYWKRTLRILPLYLFCLAGVLVFFRHSGLYVLMSLFFVANLAPHFHVSNIGGPFWTLAIEEQFYLLWPTVVRRLSVRQISQVALAIVVSTMLFRISWALKGHYDCAFLFARADGLALGAYIACRNQSWYERKAWTASDAIACCCAVVVALVLFFAVSPLAPFQATVALGAALQQAAVTLLFGAVVAFAVAKSGAPYLGFLRSQSLRFFGLISYALYLLHLWVMYIYDRFIPLATGDTRGYFIRFFVILCGSIAFSLATRHLIELPALDLRKYVIPSSREHTKA